jgi:hypothetical protein
MEVNNELYSDILVNEVLKIKWNKCRVVDNLNLIKCFKCSGFNHYADQCKNEIAFPKCSEKHAYNECKSECVRCVNCTVANKNYNLKLSVDHPSWSKECKVLQRKINIKKNMNNNK